MCTVLTHCCCLCLVAQHVVCILILMQITWPDLCLNAGKKVLELGCGAGMLGILLQRIGAAGVCSDRRGTRRPCATACTICTSMEHRCAKYGVPT